MHVIFGSGKKKRLKAIWSGLLGMDAFSLRRDFHIGYKAIYWSDISCKTTVYIIATSDINKTSKIKLAFWPIKDIFTRLTKKQIILIYNLGYGNNI